MARSGLSPFRGRLSGAAIALRWPLRARQSPDYLCLCFLTLMIYYLLPFVWRPDSGYAPSQFIPFDPFLSGGMYCSAPHGLHALKLSLVGTVLSPGAPQLMLHSLRLDAGVLLLLDVARWRTAVRLQDCLDGTSRRSCTSLLCCSLDSRKTRAAWRALGCIVGSRLQPSHGSGQNVLYVKYFICKKLRNT